jgi:hypothetical protein
MKKCERDGCDEPTARRFCSKRCSGKHFASIPTKRPLRVEYWLAKGLKPEEAELRVSFEKRRRSRFRPEFWTARGFDAAEAEKLASNEAYAVGHDATEKVRARLGEDEFRRWVRKRSILCTESGRSSDQISREQKLRSPMSLDYWTCKGHDTAAATSMRRSYIRSNNPRCMPFWLSRGFDEIEAKSFIRELNKTFTLEKCITKLGCERGHERWLRRQNKWQASLKRKSPEEIADINRRKVQSVRAYSKVSQVLFVELAEACKLDLLYGDQEYFVSTSDYFYKMDCFHLATKRCIEFYGTLWHADPRIFGPDQVTFTGVHAKEIWQRDALRINRLQEHGIEVMIVWEMDWMKDPRQTLERCISFLHRRC